MSMASEGLNLVAIIFTLYRNVRFVIRNGYNEDALKVFPFLGMVVMASVFVSEQTRVIKKWVLTKTEWPLKAHHCTRPITFVSGFDPKGLFSSIL